VNEDFFAAVVGGDKGLGHQVIFYQPELSWFFFDPAAEKYLPTSEGKLRLFISNVMMMCAEAMNQRFVDVEPLFGGAFRSDKGLKAVIGRAEAMHAAGEDFFKDEKNVRFDAPATDIVPRLFVKEVLTEEPQGVLTVGDAFANHLSFSKIRGLTPLQRREFKSLIAEVIREEFGVGLRHDLRSEDGRSSQGWSGLGIRRDVLLAN
jgi:hypothetical protein